MRRHQHILVSEPTMHDGVWTLAAFDWRMTSTVTRTDIEDGYLPPLQVIAFERSYIALAFANWLTKMPAVARWDQQLKYSTDNDFFHDTIIVSSTARGWFDLCDDDAKTEAMLAAVTAEKLDGMPDLVKAGDQLMIPVVLPLIRPGSADNDFNPACREPLYDSPARLMMPPPFRNDGGI